MHLVDIGRIGLRSPVSGKNRQADSRLQRTLHLNREEAQVAMVWGLYLPQVGGRGCISISICCFPAQWKLYSITTCAQGHHSREMKYFQNENNKKNNDNDGGDNNDDTNSGDKDNDDDDADDPDDSNNDDDDDSGNDSGDFQHMMSQVHAGDEE